MTTQRIDSVQRIVLHHSVTPTTTTAKTIREMHVAKGWADIGYHFVIRTAKANGTHAIVDRGRSLDTVPASQRGRNVGTWAICIAGDNTSSTRGWRSCQIAKAVELIDWLLLIRGERLPVQGHRDAAHPKYPTVCAGLDIRSIPELRRFLR
jgi:DNA mismatch repair protein MutH